MNSSPETCNNNTMKRILLAACLLMTVACNSKTSTAMQTTTEPVFGLGVPVSDNFTGEAWLRTLSAEPGYDCQIYNVTFAPSTRNYWHRHAVGQILLCTEGIGFYSGTRRSGTPFNPRRRGKYPGRDDSLARCGAGQPFHTYRDYSGSESKPSRMAR